MEEEPPRTIPDTFNIELKGWITDSEEDARLFGEKLMALTRECSRYYDLAFLEKIIVAWDYPAALAAVTSGSDNAPATPTSNEFGEGFAMAVRVRNGDTIKSVLVIQTVLIAQMFDDPESDIQRASLQSFMHELVHIDDQAFFARTFPGGVEAALSRDVRHGTLLKIVDGAHNEYSATRGTAVIHPRTGLAYLDLLEHALRDAHAEMLDRRKRYQRRLISLDEFWDWAEERARFIFQALGYALGHFDGAIAYEDLPADLRTEFSDSMAVIEAMPLGWLVEATREGIEPIYTQTEWSGLDVLEPLHDVAERLLNEFGLYTSVRNEGLYIDVPFRGLMDL